MKLTSLSAVIFLCPLALFAAEEKKSLDAEVELGAILTSGNTETTSLKGKLDVTHDLKSWKNQYVIETLYKEDELENEDGEKVSQTTAEKLFLSARGGYKLNTDHKEFFVVGQYEDNKFSGFEYQYSISIGYSDRLFTHDNSHLAFSIGPGYQVSQPVPVEDTLGNEIDQDEESNAIIYASLEYVYKFSDHAKFKQFIETNAAAESGANTKTKSVTSVSANINSSLAMKASFTIDHNSEVAEGLDNADTQTALTVVYSF